MIIAAIVGGVVAVVMFDATGRKGSGLSKEFSYDVGAAARIDPNLILYEESAQPISTGFSHAHCLAIGPDGLTYVTGDKAVRVFGGDGKIVRQIKLAGAARPVAVARDGRVFVGLSDHIKVFDEQGQPLAAWQSLGDKAVTTSIAVTQNDVFVADAGNRVVVRYDMTGKLVGYIGKKDVARNIPGFIIPSPYFDLAVARDGLLRVVNPGLHRIEAYTFDGDLELSWGEFSSGIAGFTGCCNPVNIALLDDGGFVTCEKGIVRVKLYDAEGTLVGVVAGPEQLGVKGDSVACQFPEQCQSGGFDVAVDAQGRVLVLDTIKNVIRVFSRKTGHKP